MKRRAATSAYFLRLPLHSQPVSARGAFWIQALHRPTGHVLHCFLASQKGRKAAEGESAPS